MSGTMFLMEGTVLEGAGYTRDKLPGDSYLGVVYAGGRVSTGVKVYTPLHIPGYTLPPEPQKRAVRIVFGILFCGLLIIAYMLG